MDIRTQPVGSVFSKTRGFQKSRIFGGFGLCRRVASAHDPAGLLVQMISQTAGVYSCSTCPDESFYGKTKWCRLDVVWNCHTADAPNPFFVKVFYTV